MLHGIVGLQNSGKTLLMTYYLFKEYLRGRTIITNYDIFFPKFPGCPKVYKINKDYLLMMGQTGKSLQNVAIGLDEIWISIADSRGAMKAGQQIITYMFLQTSKDDTNLFFTAQHIGQVEKRLRDNMHRISMVNRVLWNEGEEEAKPVSEGKRFLPDAAQDYLYIRCREYNRKAVGIMGIWKKRAEDKLIKAKPIYRLYNTRQHMNVGSSDKYEFDNGLEQLQPDSPINNRDKRVTL
jgi:hypothetical protein